MKEGEVFYIHFKEKLLNKTESTNNRISIEDLNDFLGMCLHVSKHIRKWLIQDLVNHKILLQISDRYYLVKE